MRAEMAQYFDRLLQRWESEHGGLPRVPYDEEVDPIVYVGSPDDEEWIQWRPVEKAVSHDVADIAGRFGLGIHPSVNQYWNSFWFCSLGGTFQRHGIDLSPVLPRREVADMEDAFAGYARAHQAGGGHAPIGVERNGLLVVVRDSDGVVCVEDYEQQSFREIAGSLAELIVQLR